MRLYIAEKPSLARALASALPSSSSPTKTDGYIALANGDVVSWCIGHILELAEPEHYNAQFKKWRLDDLPIIPQQWHYQPKAQTHKQLKILLELIKKATSIVHVGDPDREGQLLVDEVINYAGVNQNKMPVLRCLINDLNTQAIAKSLSQLKDNRDFIPLSASALARSRADWLYGINMTRLCSLKGQAQGFSGVLSVGRVQTPILGLVVARDREISNFISKPFYSVNAHLNAKKNQAFIAKWLPSEACQDYCDDEGRILSKALAQNVATRITQQNGTVTEVKKQRKTLNPPLPYSLSSLQVDASKRYGLAAKAVLDICQNLYEKHKLITYPRSDCRYLPEDHFSEANAISRTIKNNCTALINLSDKANTQLKSKAWDNSKITAHHAIIPTNRQLKTAVLSGDEAKVYELISRQYLMQFYPAHTLDETSIHIKILTGDFIAKANTIVNVGWKVAIPSTPSAASDNDSMDNETSHATLPALKKGDSVFCERGEVIEKNTTPPKPYTDATLIAAMTGIAKYVTDSEIRKILKETDGLGTEATRAGILDLLMQREFLVRQGKNINATDAGHALIASLPSQATTPDMTAHWESKLNAIANKSANYSDFMQALEQQLPSLMASVEGEKLKSLKSTAKTKPIYRKAKNASNPQRTRRKKAS
ncbi:MAG: DNA topoisomerase III [Marinagarivorans sp.]|nr:DNA topoisomerase III [Marinagarivorans sp.]